MKTIKLVLPVAALGAAAALLVPVEQTDAYTILFGGLPLVQRDFRIFNNFTQSTANNNQTPDANFPGAQGAVMAIWKGCIEWQSELHGDGNGDPHQPFGLGSGGANFDPSYQAESLNVGGINDNIHSMISGCQGGVLAFTESPGTNGWRIRYYQCWQYEDGPGTFIPGIDLQGVACHEYGHALGLGHSNSGSATMFPSISGSGVSARSIAVDDQNGVRAIYGVAGAGKPSIDELCISGDQMVITGTGFSPSNNQVWFTKAGTGGNGTPIKVSGLLSNGTEITVTIPGTAAAGDVLVKNNGNGFANLSNAYPTDLQPTGGSCGGAGCPDPTSYCLTSPNSVGAGMLMSWAGTASVGAQDLTLIATGGPAFQTGIFYYGPDQVQLPFGDGFRCVGPGLIGTFRLPPIQIDSFGDAAYTIDWNSPPVNSGPGALVSGVEHNFQFWYRDPAAGMSGFNFSDGLNIVFCP